jgi:hypothetical protein
MVVVFIFREWDDPWPASLTTGWEVQGEIVWDGFIKYKTLRKDKEGVLLRVISAHRDTWLERHSNEQNLDLQRFPSLNKTGLYDY